MILDEFGGDLFMTWFMYVYLLLYNLTFNILSSFSWAELGLDVNWDTVLSPAPVAIVDLSLRFSVLVLLYLYNEIQRFTFRVH